MLLDKQYASYCLPVSTNSYIIFYCLSFPKWELISGQIMMDLSLASADKIGLKLKCSKSGCTQCVNTIKSSSFMKHIKTCRLFRLFYWF